MVEQALSTAIHADQLASATHTIHPGICPVYEAGEHEGLPYLAMPRLGGQTLAARIAMARSAGPGARLEVACPAEVLAEAVRAPAGIRARAGLLHAFEQLAAAVQHAHDHGVVHRDLKPHNVMLVAGDLPVVLDFGLAKDHDQAALTLTGELLGTPMYMPRESILGLPQRSGPQVDVYALGVMLHECLLLRPPFSAGSRHALQEAIVRGDHEDLLAADRSLPRDLGAVVGKAMALHDRQRYRSARELADELRALRRGERVRARLPGPWERALGWSRRNRMLAAVLVGCSLLALLASAKAWRVRAAQQIARLLSTAAVVHTAKDEERALGAGWPGQEGAIEAWEQRYATAVGDEALVRRLAELEAFLAPDEDAGDAPVAGDVARDTLRPVQRELAAYLRGPTGVLERVAALRAWARSGALALRDRYREEWQEAARLARELPAYQGVEFDLVPQWDLVPLGVDPRSGLLEFAHARNGSIPVRGDDGELRYEQDAAAVLVLLPGGETRMGREGDPWFPPSPGVRLAPFFLGKHELTQAQWRRLWGSLPSTFVAGTVVDGERITLRHPVETISVYEAEAALASVGLLLPTEAQWEYGCRAGVDADGYWEPNPGAVKWHCMNAGPDEGEEWLRNPEQREHDADGFRLHAAVGSFLPNRFGLYDVLGNVHEMCRDMFGLPYQELRDCDGLRRSSLVEFAVLRGGAFDGWRACRAQWRHPLPRDMKSGTIGVRVGAGGVVEVIAIRRRWTCGQRSASAAGDPPGSSTGTKSSWLLASTVAAALGALHAITARGHRSLQLRCASVVPLVQARAGDAERRLQTARSPARSGASGKTGGRSACPCSARGLSMPSESSTPKESQTGDPQLLERLVREWWRRFRTAADLDLQPGLVEAVWGQVLAAPIRRHGLTPCSAFDHDGGWTSDERCALVLDYLVERVGGLPQLGAGDAPFAPLLVQMGQQFVHAIHARADREGSAAYRRARRAVDAAVAVLATEGDVHELVAPGCAHNAARPKLRQRLLAMGRVPFDALRLLPLCRLRELLAQAVSVADDLVHRANGRTTLRNEEALAAVLAKALRQLCAQCRTTHGHDFVRLDHLVAAFQDLLVAATHPARVLPADDGELADRRGRNGSGRGAFEELAAEGGRGIARAVAKCRREVALRRKALCGHLLRQLRRRAMAARGGGGTGYFLQADLLVCLRELLQKRWPTGEELLVAFHGPWAGRKRFPMPGRVQRAEDLALVRSVLAQVAARVLCGERSGT